MAKTDIGRAVPLLKGEYNPATTYELNDIVSLNGSLYWHYSHEVTTNVAPQATSTWKVVLSLDDAEEFISRAETAAGEAEDAKDAALAAQTAAETASTTATGASATATAARNDAVTAKTAAETAQAGAVSAKNDAVTAKEAAQTAASSAGTSATNANNSAGTAQYYAESAGTSASTATTKAGEASASATTASTAATTATTKASEASASATTATTKAGEASTSATSAASSAAAAQDVLDSIPEDYSQLSEDVGDLKTQLKNTITLTDATYIKYADGTVGTNYAQTKSSEFVAVFPGQTFNLSGYVANETIAEIIGLAFYDADKKYVNGVQYDGNNISTQVPNGAFFVRFTVYTSCANTYIANVGSLELNHDFTLREKYYFTKAEKNTGLTNLGAMPKYEEIIDNITFESGKYVTSNGTVSTVWYSSLSDFIDAENIETVYAAICDGMPISFYDANKTWISNYYDSTVTFQTAVPKEYNIELPQNAKYIRISNVTTKCPNNKVYVGRGYGYIKSTKETKPSVTNGKYVATVNSGAEASVWYAEVTDFIEVYNVASYYTALNSVLSVCYYNENKQYISGVIGTDGESPAWRNVNAPQNAKYIRISNNKRNNANGIIVKYDLTENIINAASKEDIENLQEQIDTTRNTLAMYDDIICIGDSLTWSQVYYSASGNRQAYKTYPEILASLCDATSHTYATPGDSAILWWERSSTGAFNNHGLYIVFLGTNAGLTDTIDTDCVGTDPSTFANTQTGQYGRILQTIANNNDCAVLILPYGGGGDSLAVTQEVIGKFGTKYSFPVISVDSAERTNAYYHYYPDKSGQNTLHFNDLGYSWLANEVCQRINKLPVSDLWNISRKQ